LIVERGERSIMEEKEGVKEGRKEGMWVLVVVDSGSGW